MLLNNLNTGKILLQFLLHSVRFHSFVFTSFSLSVFVVSLAFILLHSSWIEVLVIYLRQSILPPFRQNGVAAASLYFYLYILVNMHFTGEARALTLRTFGLL